jgi:AraC family transcriptional activator of pobA
MSRVIPRYALYGESTAEHWQNAFNFEWIPERSGPNNWEIRPHMHESFVQILFMTEGSGSVLFNNDTWAMQAPCLVLIPQGHVHGFHFSSAVNGPVVTAAQRPLESLAHNLMPEMLPLLKAPALFSFEHDSPHKEALMSHYLAIEREWRVHHLGHVAMGMSLMMSLLIQVTRLASVHAPEQTPATGRKAQQVERFRTQLDANFREHLPLEHYAEKLGITVGQLSRICRDTLGISALDVVNQRILHEARRDLVYTSLSVKQIAASLGYMNEAYFGRFFRRHTSQSPGEFRQQARQSMSEFNRA